MLIIDASAREKLVDTLIFALNNGCVKQLTDRLEHLARYGQDPEATDTAETDEFQALLFADWADYSFAFVLQRRTKGKPWHNLMNGGLIYHGPGANTDPLSVEVDPSDEHHWGVHT